MKTPQEILEELLKHTDELLSLKNEFIKVYDVKDRLETSYAREVEKATWKLRADKIPATLITNLVKGDKTVSYTKYKLDEASTICKALKFQIDSLNTAITAKQTVLNWYKQEYAATTYGGQ